MKDLPPGSGRFGKYELLSRLAKGGMAETFRAQLTGAAGVTKQLVIKKVLPSFAEDEDFIAAFINEARVSTCLSHGNIAQVFDFGEVDGNYFIAMELVDGRSLGAVLERAAQRGFQRLPEPIACFLAIEILKGLHYAHTRVGDNGRPLEIVHRDISPENVLVSFEGHTKVVDFGVAKAAMRGRRETEPGMVKGKFLYFSPEQAAAGPLDGRSDVFAVGILLYRMLCGELPFAGQIHVVMRAIATGKFRPPAVVNPALAGALIQVLDKALATRREERFATALEMQDAIASFLFRREPTFSSEMIKEWMHWLFREDLESEGRPTSVSTRFAAQLERWSPAARSTAVQPRPEISTREQLATGDGPAPTKTQRTSSGWGGRWIGVGGAAAGGLLLVAIGAQFIGSDSEPPASQRLGPVGQGSEQRERERILAAAAGLIEHGDWAQATDILETCAVGGAACPEAIWVIRQMAAQKDAKAALEAAELALAGGELEKARPLLNVASGCELMRKRYEVAALRYRTSTARDIAPISFYDEAKALMAEKQYPAARAKLERCLKLTPKNADCHKLLGTVCAKQGDPYRGADEYRLFLKYAPVDHPDIEKVKGILEAFEYSK